MAAENPFNALHISLNEYALSLWDWWLPNANVFSFFSSSKYSDLIIRCEAQEFKVHKIVVCGQSKYFSSICDGDWKVRLGTGYLDSMITGIAHNINLRSLGSGRWHSRAQRRQYPRC